MLPPQDRNPRPHYNLGMRQTPIDPTLGLGFIVIQRQVTSVIKTAITESDSYIVGKLLCKWGTVVAPGHLMSA